MTFIFFFIKNSFFQSKNKFSFLVFFAVFQNTSVFSCEEDQCFGSFVRIESSIAAALSALKQENVEEAEDSYNELISDLPNIVRGRESLSDQHKKSSFQNFYLFYKNCSSVVRQMYDLSEKLIAKAINRFPGTYWQLEKLPLFILAFTHDNLGQEGLQENSIVVNLDKIASLEHFEAMIIRELINFSLQTKQKNIFFYSDEPLADLPLYRRLWLSGICMAALMEIAPDLSEHRYEDQRLPFLVENGFYDNWIDQFLKDGSFYQAENSLNYNFKFIPFYHKTEEKKKEIYSRWFTFSGLRQESLRPLDLGCVLGEAVVKDIRTKQGWDDVISRKHGLKDMIDKILKSLRYTHSKILKNNYPKLYRKYEKKKERNLFDLKKSRSRKKSRFRLSRFPKSYDDLSQLSEEKDFDFTIFDSDILINTTNASFIALLNKLSVGLPIHDPSSQGHPLVLEAAKFNLDLLELVVAFGGDVFFDCLSLLDDAESKDTRHETVVTTTLSFQKDIYHVQDILDYCFNCGVPLYIKDFEYILKKGNQDLLSRSIKFFSLKILLEETDLNYEGINDKFLRVLKQTIPSYLLHETVKIDMEEIFSSYETREEKIKKLSSSLKSFASKGYKLKIINMDWTLLKDALIALGEDFNFSNLSSLHLSDNSLSPEIVDEINRYFLSKAKSLSALFLNNCGLDDLSLKILGESSNILFLEILFLGENSFSTKGLVDLLKLKNLSSLRVLDLTKNFRLDVSVLAVLLAMDSSKGLINVFFDAEKILAQPLLRLWQEHKGDLARFFEDYYKALLSRHIYQLFFSQITGFHTYQSHNVSL